MKPISRASLGNRRGLEWIALAALTPSSLYGLGIQITDLDAFATARGNAFVATADNPSAVYYNPAGITQLSGHQFRMGTYAVTYQITYRPPGGGPDVESDRAYEFIPQIYYTFSPADSPVAVGLGAYSQFGLSMEWPEDSGFRTLGRKAHITQFTVQPVIAWRVHSTLSIAAGPTVSYANVDLHQGLTPVPSADDFRFEGDDLAPGFSVGARFAPGEAVAFGLVYRSSTTLDLDGHTQTTAPFLALRQNASAELEFPQQVAMGVSWRPAPAWNLEFNAEWTDWDSFDVVTIRQATPVPPLILEWKSSWRYAGGATRYFPEGWRVSAGYMYAETSTPDQHFNPLVPDTDRHVFSGGVGRSVGRWSFDLVYQFIYGTVNTVRGSTPSPAGESADGRYESMGHALTMTAGLRF